MYPGGLTPSTQKSTPSCEPGMQLYTDRSVTPDPAARPRTARVARCTPAGLVEDEVGRVGVDLRLAGLAHRLVAAEQVLHRGGGHQVRGHNVFDAMPSSRISSAIPSAHSVMPNLAIMYAVGFSHSCRAAPAATASGCAGYPGPSYAGCTRATPRRCRAPGCRSSGRTASSAPR